MDIIIVEEIEVYLDNPLESFTEHRMIYSGSEPYLIQKHKNFIQLQVDDLTTRHYGKVVVKSNTGVELFRYESESSYKPQLVSIKEKHHLNAFFFYRTNETLILSILSHGEGVEAKSKQYIIADAGQKLSFTVEANDGSMHVVKALHKYGGPDRLPPNRLFLDLPKYEAKTGTTDRYCDFGFTDLLSTSKVVYGIEQQNAMIRYIQVHRRSGIEHESLEANYIHELHGRFIELDDASEFLQNLE